MLVRTKKLENGMYELGYRRGRAAELALGSLSARELERHDTLLTKHIRNRLVCSFSCGFANAAADVANNEARLAE